MHDVEVRFLEPRDVPSLCSLLTDSFRREYEEQGLDVWSFERQYRLVSWANELLAPLSLDFFQVVVAVADGEVVGTMGSFPADRHRWYQGFGAVAPACRGHGLYKRVIRKSLEGIARRGARWGGGEIRVDNHGALVPYRDVFGTDVMPVRRLYLVSREQAAKGRPAGGRRLPIERLGDRDWPRLPAAETLRRRFLGGFLVERELSRGLAACLLRWLLPPITVATWGRVEDGRVVALARVRTHWPAKILAVDAVHLDEGLPRERAAGFLTEVLARVAPQAKAPMRIYAAEDEVLLRSLCEELGYRAWTDVLPIRTDVARALAMTDPMGRPRPEAAS